MSDLWDAIARHADAVARAHEQLGSHLAPSPGLRDEVLGAAAGRGLVVDFCRVSDPASEQVRWYAEVRTVRGAARQAVTAGDDENIDECWRDAFRQLGVIE